MADVFLSFKHADRDRVTLIAEKLQGLGYSVWLRPTPTAELADSAIAARELRAAKCVLACWSQASSACAEIRTDAAEARARGVLAACRLDPTMPPPPFDRMRSEDISDWLGESRHNGWLQLCAVIGQRVRGERAAAETTLAEIAAVVRTAPPQKLLKPLAVTAAMALVGVVGAMMLQPGAHRTPSVAVAALDDAERLATISNQLAAITARFATVQAQLPKNDARRIRAELNAVIEIVALLSARVEVQSAVDAADWVTPQNALALLAEDIASLEARLSQSASANPSPTKSEPRPRVIPAVTSSVATAAPVPAIAAPSAPPEAAPPVAADPVAAATPPEPAAAAAAVTATQAAPPTPAPEPSPAEPPQPANQPLP